MHNKFRTCHTVFIIFTLYILLLCSIIINPRRVGDLGYVTVVCQSVCDGVCVCDCVCLSLLSLAYLVI